MAEAAHSFKQAVDFAPDEEKDSLREEAVEELKRLGLACISLRQKRFSQYPDDEELNGFVSDIEPLVDGLVVLLSKEAEVAEANVLAGVPKEFFSQIATMMGNAATVGFNTAKTKYANDNRPMPNDFKKTMNEVDKCIMLSEMAISASNDDGDDDITRYNNQITMQEYCIDMSAYADYSSSYRTWSLTDESKKKRNN